MNSKTVLKAALQVLNNNVLTLQSEGRSQTVGVWSSMLGRELGADETRNWAWGDARLTGVQFLHHVAVALRGFDIDSDGTADFWMGHVGKVLTRGLQ